MNKRGAGISFIAIAALLYSTKYISAAIFGSTLTDLDGETYAALVSYISGPLTQLSFVSLVVGIIYLGWAEFEEFINRKKQK